MDNATGQHAPPPQQKHGTSEDHDHHRKKYRRVHAKTTRAPQESLQPSSPYPAQINLDLECRLINQILSTPNFEDWDAILWQLTVMYVTTSEIPSLHTICNATTHVLKTNTIIIITTKHKCE